METNSPAEKFADIIGDVPEDFAEIFEQISELLCVKGSNIIPKLTNKIDEIQELRKSIEDKERQVESFSYKEIEQKMKVYEKLLQEMEDMNTKLNESKEIFWSCIAKLHNMGTIELLSDENTLDYTTLSGVELKWNPQQRALRRTSDDTNIPLQNLKISAGSGDWLSATNMQKSSLDKKQTVSLLQQFTEGISEYHRQIAASSRDHSARFEQIKTQSSAASVLD